LRGARPLLVTLASATGPGPETMGAYWALATSGDISYIRPLRNALCPASAGGVFGLWYVKRMEVWFCQFCYWFSLFFLVFYFFLNLNNLNLIFFKSKQI
jgi:hypothetical protein